MSLPQTQHPRTIVVLKVEGFVEVFVEKLFHAGRKSWFCSIRDVPCSWTPMRLFSDSQKKWIALRKGISTDSFALNLIVGWSYPLISEISANSISYVLYREFCLEGCGLQRRVWLRPELCRSSFGRVPDAVLGIHELWVQRSGPSVDRHLEAAGNIRWMCSPDPRTTHPGFPVNVRSCS